MTHLLLALTPITYLFTVGVNEYFRAEGPLIQSVLDRGFPRWGIYLAFLFVAPLAVAYGAKVCWRRVAEWVVRRKVRQTLKKIADNHKDNPELQKDMQDLIDKIR